MKQRIPDDDELYRLLEPRIGRLHLRQRLGIEKDKEARVFGQGLNFFHIENWYSLHSVIRNSLRLMFLYGRGRRNTMAIQLRHNEIVLPRLPRNFDGYTILHISDLHLDMNSGFPEVLADRVMGVNCDVCVLTGDFRYRTFGDCKAALAGMEHVMGQINGPVYGILGNHDSIRMVPVLENMGIHMLLNESVTLMTGNEKIDLVGVDDPHYYRADNMEKAYRNFHDDTLSILLAHTPEIYRQAAHAGFDIMLCGHTHGGQICLPGGVAMMRNARAPRSICAGPWRYHQLAGYTSVGAGSSVVDVRLNCMPEITLHRLVATSTDSCEFPADRKAATTAIPAE